MCPTTFFLLDFPGFDAEPPGLGRPEPDVGPLMKTGIDFPGFDVGPGLGSPDIGSRTTFRCFAGLVGCGFPPDFSPSTSGVLKRHFYDFTFVSRAQSFTSLMADLCQDITRVSFT